MLFTDDDDDDDQKCQCFWLKLLESDREFVQKYLIRQNELGFEQFYQLYGKLAYNKVDSDEPAPEVQVTSLFV